LFKEAKLSGTVVRAADELLFVTEASEKSLRLTRNSVPLGAKLDLAFRIFTKNVCED
jgi:CO dehydrogenase nickel-insertion accessory protein CooC1